MFCKHQWKVVDKTVIPSKMEVWKRQKANIGRGFSFPLDFDSLLIEKVVITIACEKCGKLKIIRETN
jgi:hypothetical protein